MMAGEIYLDFTAKSNGHVTSVPGNPAFNQVELQRIDKRQSVVKEMKDGALLATVRQTLSNNGNELTITTTSRGDPDQITVWSRSGGPKIARDPIAGQWTEDLSKTRLRQGMILNIRPDWSGGVRFSGGFSYDAHFDGKLYNLQNSRNDTVTLQLIDPHIVDSVYRRDDQVTQKDRAIVSPDGQTMTITTTATLENGQHLTEKLAFKKQ